MVYQKEIWSTKKIRAWPKIPWDWTNFFLVDQKKEEIDWTIGRPRDWPKSHGRDLWSTNFFFGIPNIFLVNQIVFLVDQISERSGFEKFIMPIGLKGPGLKVWTQTVWGQWFLAVNHHIHKNWVPSILIHNFWLILIRMKKIFLFFEKKKFKIANSQYLFVKIYWIGPWVSKIEWCEGHWSGSTYTTITKPTS